MKQSFITEVEQSLLSILDNTAQKAVDDFPIRCYHDSEIALRKGDVTNEF